MKDSRIWKNEEAKHDYLSQMMSQAPGIENASDLRNVGRAHTRHVQEDRARVAGGDTGSNVPNGPTMGRIVDVDAEKKRPSHHRSMGGVLNGKEAPAPSAAGRRQDAINRSVIEKFLVSKGMTGADARFGRD